MTRRTLGLCEGGGNRFPNSDNELSALTRRPPHTWWRVASEGVSRKRNPGATSWPGVATPAGRNAPAGSSATPARHGTAFW